MVKNIAKEILSYILWPLLLGIPIFMVYLGIKAGRPTLYFNIAYLSLGVSLFVLERVMPYRDEWVKSDGQEFPDFAHTILNKGLIQLGLFLLLISGIIETMGHKSAYSFWPSGLPMAVQVLIAMVVSEFGLYWKHRLAHTWDFMWVTRTPQRRETLVLQHREFISWIPSAALFSIQLFHNGCAGCVRHHFSSIIVGHCPGQRIYAGGSELYFHTPTCHSAPLPGGK
jgi:hypothetical protein